MLYAFQIPSGFADPEADYIEVIERDLYRTVFLSRKHEYQAFDDNLHKDDTDESYSQGNITAAIIGGAKTTMLQQYFYVNAPDSIEALYSQHKNFSVAFIDKQGRDCGLAFTYQGISPNYFTVSYIRNTRAIPEEREVTCYQSSDNTHYPSLSELITPVDENNKADNAEQTLIPQTQMKQQLLAIDSLPNEIQFLIMDAINAKGELIPSAIEGMNEAITCGRINNQAFKFNSDIALESIQHNKALCDKFLEKLEAIDQIKGDRDDTKDLRSEITKTLTRINNTLKNNDLKQRFDLQSSYLEQSKNIQTLVTRLLIKNKVLQQGPLVESLEISAMQREDKDFIATSKPTVKQKKDYVDVDDNIDSLDTPVEQTNVSETIETLVFFRSLCSSFLQQLDKTQRKFPSDLKASITATLTDINEFKRQLELTPNGTDCIDTQKQVIQSSIEGYLSHKALNQPYHSLLNSLHLNYKQWNHLSLTTRSQRIGHELIAASGFALLSIGLLIAANTLVISSVLACSILIPLCIGSLALFGFAAFKEWQYSQRDEILKTDVKGRINTFVQSPHSLDTFDFCLENKSVLTPEPNFLASEASFFSQVSKECRDEQALANTDESKLDDSLTSSANLM
mgnify:CR=1 FL=1